MDATLNISPKKSTPMVSFFLKSGKERERERERVKKEREQTEASRKTVTRESHPQTHLELRFISV